MMADTIAGNNQGRKSRSVRTGFVKTSMCDKTITVVMEYRVKHPKYGKYIRRRTKFYAHDEQNLAKPGDQVEIMECRPMSKTKHWRLVRVVRAADAR
jgi:small subunit ribosomal protein S17